MSGSPLYGGVETGGTWCVCALGRGPEDLVAIDTFPTGGPAETFGRIAAFFDARPRARAIGIASFGPIDLTAGSPRWGRLLCTPKPGWSDAPVGPALRDALDAEIVLDTDVNAAALGEQRWGAAQDVSSVCYLTVGTGIGAGLVIEGRPVHGLLHPEAGHLRVPRDPARDPFAGACAVHGDCWEGLASGAALRARWGIPGSELSDDHPGWELEVDYLATGILAIVLIACPERVVLGGGVMARESLFARVRSRLRELLGGYTAFPRLGGDLGDYLVAPRLGDRAGVLGAIALAQDGVRA